MEISSVNFILLTPNQDQMRKMQLYIGPLAGIDKIFIYSIYLFNFANEHLNTENTYCIWTMTGNTLQLSPITAAFYI